MICKHSANIFQQAQAYFSSKSNDSKYLVLYKLFYSSHLFAHSQILYSSLEYCYAPAAIQHQSLVCKHSNKYTGYVRD